MRKLRLAIIFVLVAGCLTGCGNNAKKYDENTIIVKKNGSVQEIAVEDYTDSSVSAEDLTAYVEEQITKYNDEHERKSVKNKSLNTEDMSKAKLLLSYKSIEDFNGFNSLNCCLKDMDEIGEEDLTGTYKNFEDGKTVKKADILAAKKAKVLVIEQQTNVVVQGDVLYYNNEVEMKENVAVTTGNENAIIIFK